MHCIAWTQAIEGNAVIVKDLDAGIDGIPYLVGAVITRIPKEIANNGFQWNAAWYLYQDGKWVTLGTKAWKMAPITSFDVRKLAVEEPEYAIVTRDDPDKAIWNTLPAPGMPNGKA